MRLRSSECPFSTFLLESVAWTCRRLAQCALDVKCERYVRQCWTPFIRRQNAVSNASRHWIDIAVENSRRPAKWAT
jgi:hypothetical protein